MELSPSTIRNASFTRNLRGFSAEEVMDFLGRVADHVETLRDERDDLADRVDQMEEKLDAIGDAAGKVKTARSRVEDLKRKAEETEKRLREESRALDERRQQIEAQHEALLSTVSNLRNVMQSETEKLSSIVSGDGSVGADAPTLDTSSSTKKRKKKSTQEWIDSLFPNRLGSGKKSSSASDASGASDVDADGASGPPRSRAPRRDAKTPDEATESTRDDGEETLPGPSHFEAIKQDVQRMESKEDRSSKPSSSSSEDDNGPSTNELERIWDIFDKQG